MRPFKISWQITNMSSNSIEKYLRDIKKYPVIDADDEFKLVQLAKEGNKTAMDKLVLSNLRFVVSVAKQYQNQGISLSDLINEGNLGLLKAAEKFDETKGFKFITYAVWWIRQSIQLSILEHGKLIKLPQSKHLKINKIKKATSKLEQTLQRQPHIYEVADELKEDSNKIAELMKLNSQNYLSTENNNEEENEKISFDCYTLFNIQPIEQNIQNEAEKTVINLILHSLSSRDAYIITMFYGLNGNKPLTFSEIACKMNLTEMQVRQYKFLAISKLKKMKRMKSWKNIYINSN